MTAARCARYHRSVSAQFSDTHPEVERRLIDGLRAMAPEQRLARVFALRQAALSLAAVRMKEQGLPDREIRLRLAATWLPADVMRRVFGWDPGSP